MVGGLPTAGAGIAHPCRRRPSTSGHPGCHTGGGRTAGRPVLPAGYASLAGQLAVACTRGRNRSDVFGDCAGIGSRSAAQVGITCLCRSRTGADGIRHPMASRRQSGVTRAAGQRGDRAAGRPAGAPVPAAAEPAAPGVRPARGTGRRTAATLTHTDRNLGSGVRIRPRNGARLRRGRRRPLHGRRTDTARRHRGGSAGRRLRRCGIRS